MLSGTVTDIRSISQNIRLITIASHKELPVFVTAGSHINILVSLETDLEPKLIKRRFTVIESEGDKVTIAVYLISNQKGHVSFWLYNEVVEGTSLSFELVERSNNDLIWKMLYEEERKDVVLIVSDNAICAIYSYIQRLEEKKLHTNMHVIWVLSTCEKLQTEDIILGGISKVYVKNFKEVIELEKARILVDQVVQKAGDKFKYILLGNSQFIHAMKTTLTVHEVPSSQILEEEFCRIPRYSKSKDSSLLRTGYTTGACAAAAAKAATRVLLQQKPETKIMLTLPNKSMVEFKLHRVQFTERRAICSVIKDAGDDPDCTDTAEIIAEVSLTEAPCVIDIERGEGVAIVTKVGLGLDVGGPSITPIPRRNITNMVLEELPDNISKNNGVEVIIHVPRGREMALDTTNARLGLLGGISILGTTGIVRPYSTAAFRASIMQAIDIALNQEQTTLVFTTGGKSEEYAMVLNKHLPRLVFIQVGDYIGFSIKYAFKKGIQDVIICGMIGKLSKMADGKVQTHQAGSQVNMQLLADLAKQAGANVDTYNKILEANTARHVLEIVATQNLHVLPDLVCQKVSWVMSHFVIGTPREELTRVTEPVKYLSIRVHCSMIDFSGNKMGEYKS